MEKMYFCVDAFYRKVTIIYWINKKQRKVRINIKKKTIHKKKLHDYEYVCINLDIWYLYTVHYYDVDASKIQVQISAIYISHHICFVLFILFVFI